MAPPEALDHRPQRLPEGLLTHLAAEHVEDHRPLVVADRALNALVLRVEGHQRDLSVRLHLYGVPLEGAASPGASGSRALVALTQVVVGAICRQRFGPVTRAGPGEDVVAPPGVDDFVIEVARTERIFPPGDNARAHQGQARHRQAAGEEVLNDVEFREGVRAQKLAVEGDVAGSSLKVLGRELVRAGQKIGRKGNRANCPRGDAVGACHEGESPRSNGARPAA